MVGNKEDFDKVRGTACIITGGLLDNIHAKTAHGLIRQSDRFDILGVIDKVHAGKDAGTFIDGKSRNIPVYPTLETLINGLGCKPEYIIIGMATKGGGLPQELYPLIREVLTEGIDLVNGLHEVISEIDEFAKLARQYNVTIHDIRKPKTYKDLHFWSGKIGEVACPKIAVLGTDCASGKRTTGKFLINELTSRGVNAHMIFTGQTGWLQGGKYGFIFDSTPNDFISGELEHAVLECWKNEHPDLIVLEGQSSLRNPSGPCGFEYIISCELEGVILQHVPDRKYFNGQKKLEKLIPPIESEIALIRQLGAETLAIALNTEGLTETEARKWKQDIMSKTNTPTILPLYDGMGESLEVLRPLLKEKYKLSINPRTEAKSLGHKKI